MVSQAADRIGLGNVENTTDLLKPISTATQTALDLKLTSTIVPTAVAALAITWVQAGIFTKSIAAHSTFTFASAADGQTIRVLVTSSGAYTVTWPTVQWAAGTPPTQTSSGKDLYGFVKIGSTIYGWVIAAALA